MGPNSQRHGSNASGRSSVTDMASDVEEKVGQEDTISITERHTSPFQKMEELNKRKKMEVKKYESTTEMGDDETDKENSPQNSQDTQKIQPKILVPPLESENPIEPFGMPNFSQSRSPSPRTRDNSKLMSQLPPKSDNRPAYTLVLDLDETLIHFTDKRRTHCPGSKDEIDEYFNIRPYALQFLRDMSKYFEIVIFTAGTQEYADWVLNQIDMGWISHRLYRQHTRVENGAHM